MKLLEKNIAQELFQTFCDGYNHRDLEKLLKLFTENTNQWGTAEDEYMTGHTGIKKQLIRDWNQSEKSRIHVKSFVPTSFDANWAAAVCQAVITINGTEHTFDHLRGTIVIEKEDNTWRIAHMHASFPDYRNSAGNSFPLNKV
jgi:uncharacterized protein (TIGR02246 family)